MPLNLTFVPLTRTFTLPNLLFRSRLFHLSGAFIFQPQMTRMTQIIKKKIRVIRGICG